MSMDDNAFDADRDHVNRMLDSLGDRKKGVWITRDGTEIKIVHMGDKHLINTIRMLDRKAETAVPGIILQAYLGLSAVRGEMAQYALEDEISDIEQNGIATGVVFPVYDDLVEEAIRRGIHGSN